MPRRRRSSVRPLFIDFDFLKTHASFDDVLVHYGCAGGRARGDELTLNCPLPDHDDRKPSCSINRADKQFHCFGCERGGSILDFIAFMEGLDPDHDTDLRAAARQLASICSLPLAERSSRQKGPKLREKAPKAAKMEVDPSSGEKTPSGGSQSEIGVSRERDLVDWHEPALIRHEPRPGELQFMDYHHPYLAARGLDPALARELEIGFYQGKGLMRERIAMAIRDWWPDGTSALVAYLAAGQPTRSRPTS